MCRTITILSRPWLSLFSLTALTLLAQPALSAPLTPRLTTENPAQERTVTGRVLSGDDNTGLPGVNVAVKGTTRGTTTDANGDYRIAVPNNQAVLVFSSVGSISQEVTVGNRSQIEVRLAADDKTLNEVVVVGYGTQKKSQLTGAISSVSAKEITELPLTNARQALQGRAAGVDVTQAGSKPGRGPQIRIRGRRSINASNDPLYVLDGIPLVGNIDDVNPNDIESLEVLKDASATAIYGSRGSNGVVLVTTKLGKPGKTVVSFDSYYGLNQSLGRIEVFNGSEFAEYVRESRRATINTATGQPNYPLPTGQSSPEADTKLFSDPVVLEGIQQGRSTDYPSFLLRQGNIQSYNLSVAGGTDKTRFYVSGNFFEDVGVVKNQDFTRYSFRVNVNHQINDKLRFGASTMLTNTLRNGELFNPLGGALQENPLGRPYDDNGNLIFLPTQDGLRTNPLAEVVPGAQLDNTKRYRMFTALFGEWTITDGLKYRLNVGPDFSIQRTGRFVGSQTNARRGGDPTGAFISNYNFNYAIENILNYTKQLSPDHSLDVTAVQAFQRNSSEGAGVSVQGIPAESQQFYSLGDASLVTGVSTGLVDWTLLSYMGRINYGFKDRYLLTLTGRADGSSRFGANNKFGYFPSVALGWNLSSEPFMQGIRWVDQLKLRASYGSVGNTGIDPYQTQPLLGRTIYAWDTAPAYGYRPLQIGNPDLKWETTVTANVGLDFGFLGGRVAGTLEYYSATTSDLLAPQPLPTSKGFNGFITNIGRTRNQGIELTLNTVNVDRGGFRWKTDLIFGRNREEILELANGKVNDVAAGRFIGQPLSVFYDLKKVGIWQTSEADEAKKFQGVPGEIKIQDVSGPEGKPDGKVDVNYDRVILGSAVPKWSGGITNRFEYKGFDLSFFVFARIGQMIQSRFHDQFNNLAGRYNNLDIDYWTPINPTNDFPRPNQNQEFPKYSNALTYFDGSFVKVRNINLGYTLPASVAGRLRMASLKVFTSINQPFIFATYRSRYKGIDPETQIDGEDGIGGGQINADISPAVRVVTFGISAKF